MLVKNAGFDVKIVNGEFTNFKITENSDLDIVKNWLKIFHKFILSLNNNFYHWKYIYYSISWINFWENMPNLLFIIVLSYLVGSIPISIILSKLVKGVDIRNFGSGNAGGTNVSRVLGKNMEFLQLY